MYQGCIPKKTKNRRPIDEIAPKKQKMYLVPRYVYVGTYVPVLHPPPQKRTEGLLMKLLKKKQNKKQPKYRSQDGRLQRRRG